MIAPAAAVSRRPCVLLLEHIRGLPKLSSRTRPENLVLLERCTFDVRHGAVFAFIALTGCVDRILVLARHIF